MTSCLSVALCVIFAVLAAEPAGGEQGLLTSSSQALDAAAKLLAEGKVDAALEAFTAIAQSESDPPFVRGLAMLGCAEAAAARREFAAAVATWQRLADSAALPQLHRDIARRRIAETERLREGLPARDPALYREQLPAPPEPALIFHVAPAGDDATEGSESKPFRTLERARDAVRALKKSRGGRLPKGGVKVLIGGGAYPVQQTFSLTSEDSGTVESPVFYQAKSGRTPVLHGGVRITAWKPISDMRLRDRLDPALRDRVLQADLNELGLTDWGDATDLRRRPELFVDGRPQTLARWPNEGFVKTGAVLGKETFTVWNTIPGCRDGKFRYLEDRPNRWLDEPDVRLYGYWFWDWFEEYQKVASIDADARVFTLSAPYSHYGYRQDQRYCAVNVFRELDRAGEWYLDRRTGMIYWLPPEEIEWSKAETVLSVFDQPFIAMNEVEHVTLLGLTVQEGRGDGIHIRGGADCLVAGCTVSRLGGDGIVVEGGRHHGVFGCTVHTVGCGGVRLAGGDRQTLTPGRHFVENCTVFDIARLKRTYSPAVHLDGCGNRIAHNLFEKMPSSAMRIEGNDHLIELNVIRDVVEESDDQGGLDMWGNPLYRGVVIRWNRWSDIRGGTENGAAGVRLDDMISGVTVHANVFERCGAVKFGAVQIHGGKENLVDGNLFLDCYAGISFSRWGPKRWLESIRRFLPQAGEPPYSTRYPELAALQVRPDVNIISRNLFVRCPSAFLRDGGVEQTALNVVTDRFDEARMTAGGQFPETEGRASLQPAIPVAQMGPYVHPWRAIGR